MINIFKPCCFMLKCSQVATQNTIQQKINRYSNYGKKILKAIGPLLTDRKNVVHGVYYTDRMNLWHSIILTKNWQNFLGWKASYEEVEDIGFLIKYCIFYPEAGLLHHLVHHFSRVEGWGFFRRGLKSKVKLIQ